MEKDLLLLVKDHYFEYYKHYNKQDSRIFDRRDKERLHKNQREQDYSLTCYKEKDCLIPLLNIFLIEECPVYYPVQQLFQQIVTHKDTRHYLYGSRLADGVCGCSCFSHIQEVYHR